MASRGMGASFVAVLIHNKRHVLSVGTPTRGMNPRVFSVWSGSPGGGAEVVTSLQRARPGARGD